MNIKADVKRYLPIAFMSAVPAHRAMAAGGLSVPTDLFNEIYNAMTTISPILGVIFFCFAGWKFFVQGARLDQLIAPIGGGLICGTAQWWVDMVMGQGS